MISKEEFVASLDRAAATLPSLPVTTSLTRFLADRLKKGEPAWWAATRQAWEERAFAHWTEAWSLFLSCVHYEALSEAENPLGAYFPSCGGTNTGDLSGAFAEFLGAAPKTFYQRLRFGQRRPYLDVRAPLWVSPAALFFQRRRLPFYLFEVNAGGGLNLAADLVVPQPKFESTLVAARLGTDSPPLRLEDVKDRRWLTAAIMPDQSTMIQALDRAIDAVVERRGREKSWIEVADLEPELAPAFVAKNVPPETGMGLLVFNSGVTVRMKDGDYSVYKASMVETLKGWGARGLWVEAELPRAAPLSSILELRVGRHLDGRWGEAVMASIDFAAKKTALDRPSIARFLYSSPDPAPASARA